MGGRGASSSATKLANKLTSGSGSHSFPIDLSTVKGKSLQEIEDRIRHLDHEEAFIFDKNGNLINGVSGGTGSVDIPMNWFNEEGATITHGHPIGDRNFGGTLSFADVDVMAHSKWKEMRAAASGQGEMNYIVRRTSHSNSTGLQSRVAADTPKMKANLQKTFLEAYTKAIKNGKPKKSAMHEAAQRAAGEVDRYWATVLPQFGFEYITRKKGYNYGR